RVEAGVEQSLGRATADEPLRARARVDADCLDADDAADGGARGGGDADQAHHLLRRGRRARRGWRRKIRLAWSRSGRALRHSIGMTETRRHLHDDLQASAPDVPIGLSRAGVTGVQKAVRIGRGAQEKLIAATIDCTVDLEPSQKGVHMSRFPELFEEAIEGVVDDDAFLVEDLAEHVARHIVERQDALLAEVHIRARYPYQRRTPVTRLATQEMVSLIGI